MPFPKECEFLAVDRWDENLYQEALIWVDEKKRAAFFSFEERVSCDPRIKIYVLDSPLQYEGHIKSIAWSAVFRKMAVLGDVSFKEKLERCKFAAELILSETADFGTVALKNARANQHSYRRGVALKNAFAGVPALVVGAGPSLEMDQHLLKEFEKKALIFAAGSALNVIATEPHFGASIDPHAPHEQFKMQPFSEIPFCYQARMNPENFSLVHGEKILFPDSSSDAINWIHGEETFDGGWTVGNFLTAVAVLLGCSPIIFVGMDYCYLNERKYTGIDHEGSQTLIRNGKYVTQSDWVLAAQWTEEMAKGRTFIDTSFEGMLQLPKEKLEEILKKWTKEWDLKSWVHKEIQNLPLCTKTRWTEWDQSLKLMRGGVDDGIVSEKLLAPLWQIWRPIFEREMAPGQKIEIHRDLFFQKVLEEHE